jgi:nicotinate-nucleotide adenylyltransferase
VLVLGPDALAQLPTWREPRTIADRCELVAVEREQLDDVAAIARNAGLADLLGQERLAALIASRVRMPAIGVRASDLRAAVAAGTSIRYRTPRAVEAFVMSQGLYRDG